MGNYLKEVAICGIVLIVSVALFLGVNGALYGAAIAGIAGIAGYELARSSMTTSEEDDDG